MQEKDYIVFESDHGPIYLEVESLADEELYDGKIPVSITQDADFLRVNKSFEESMLNVETLYKALFSRMKKLGPDEFNLEVGVKFNIKTGFFMLSAGSEVQFKLGLKWKLSE